MRERSIEAIETLSEKVATRMDRIYDVEERPWIHLIDSARDVMDLHPEVTSIVKLAEMALKRLEVY